MTRNETFRKILQDNSIAISLWVVGALTNLVLGYFNMYAANQLAPLVKDTAVVKESLAQVKETLSEVQASDRQKVDRDEFNHFSNQLTSIDNKVTNIYSILAR